MHTTYHYEFDYDYDPTEAVKHCLLYQLAFNGNQVKIYTSDFMKTEMSSNYSLVAIRVKDPHFLFFFSWVKQHYR